MPWVGIDIGGTLAKVAYFEYYENGDNMKQLGNGHTAVQDFVKSAYQYGSDGERDARLEIQDVQLGTRKGNLHFIRFPTSRMDAFFELAEEMRAEEFLQKKVYATGGGGYKFEKEFKEVGLSRTPSPTYLISFVGKQKSWKTKDPIGSFVVPSALGCGDDYMIVL